MDDAGMPQLEAQSMATPAGQPLDMAVLANIRLDEELEWLLRMEAVMTTRGPDEESVRVDIESWADATRAVKAVRRRRPTRELLTQVLELYNQGGIAAVEKGTNYSQSYCFKLLRKAKEEIGS
jgi:hypothetical protein